MILMILSATILLVNACGRKEAATDGCPAGSYMANSTDKILGGGKETYELSGGIGTDPLTSVGNFALRYTPVIFTVVEKNGEPRNNVCIVLYTNGYYWADYDYSIPLTGTGNYNRITMSTDASGRIAVYWATEILPLSAPTRAGAAGLDQKGNSFLTANTGVLSATFEVDWTVKGNVP